MFGHSFLCKTYYILLAIIWIGTAASTKAEELPFIVDFLPKSISVDSSFSGAKIMVFGMKTVPGDIIVSVRGPERTIVVRQKKRVAGLWINRDSVAFGNVPQFFAFASSKPLKNIIKPDQQNSYEIGVEHVVLNPIWIQTSDEVNKFREALRRSRTKSQLYSPLIEKVVVLRNSLFRVTLELPANIPTGNYVLEALLIDDFQIINRLEKNILVEKSGMAANISDYAKNNEVLYGIIAVLAALVAGWLGGVVFRKR